MNGKIIKTEWRSGIDSVCIVAVDHGRYWQAYIGAHRQSQMYGMKSESPEATEKRTAEHGCKLSWKEAGAFFPELPIEKYKTIPDYVREAFERAKANE